MSTYSAGNYKKTAIATVLLQRPAIAYLDEPLETVDSIARERVMEIFRTMSAAGSSLFISTQDIDLCMSFDYVQVFAQLTIVAEGTPEEVLGTNPRQRFFELTGARLPQEELGWLK
ncbi:hypothetical protein P4N68_09405 [Corynebacterium felinum]|uniref:ABC-type multidrug transport system ATPase subunit n=1 Tax=Corynebacterium felinum TaxID=131318 RepID=A0ABU2B884_9CORY|nr:hypothetical protein [Corynebacterium felinum]MDF5821291.1 hypothetical protein [Corynebacterium felinum]MDR7354828.1 ABC-type multidrug transport system ATPase subunit [Corynebacterium felinum]WJY94188.1 Cobalt import ATP-binding protein CbiO [Corynebacterium felinum]